jgi:hypothetical protein
MSRWDDPILRKWVNERYLRPDVIADVKESCCAKPYTKYAVLDDFFNESTLADYFEQHKRLDFRPDDVGLPYDSQVIFGAPHLPGGELEFHRPWHELISALSGTKLNRFEEKTVVKIRKHEGDSKGFWIHSDRSKKNPSRLAVLTYLNKNWKAADGALLQLWQTVTADAMGRVRLVERDHGRDLAQVLALRSDPAAMARKLAEVRAEERVTMLNVDHHRADAMNRLDFLHTERVFSIQIPSLLSLESHQVFMVDQIVPVYNRVVLLDFSKGPGYHSVTPSCGSTRYAIVQWMY